MHGTILTRQSDGRFRSTRSALDRFRSKCRFDPLTGCVVWTAATTSAQGKTAEYGYFWFEGKMWLAHRWAARYIHGLDISDPTTQVDHCCFPDRPCNTLCVQHVRVLPATVNRELQWIRVQVGLDRAPDVYQDDPDDVPYYVEPEWLTHAN